MFLSLIPYIRDFGIQNFIPLRVITKLVEHIVKDEGICGGQPRIAGTRIKVQHIVLEYERLGWTPIKFVIHILD